jgi:hypothetical protein
MSFVDAENNHFISLSKGNGVSISGILNKAGSYSALNLSSRVGKDGEHISSIYLGYYDPGSNGFGSPYTYIDLDAERINGGTFYGSLVAPTV